MFIIIVTDLLQASSLLKRSAQRDSNKFLNFRNCQDRQEISRDLCNLRYENKYGAASFSIPTTPLFWHIACDICETLCNINLLCGNLVKFSSSTVGTAMRKLQY